MFSQAIKIELQLENCLNVFFLGGKHRWITSLFLHSFPSLSLFLSTDFHFSKHVSPHISTMTGVICKEQIQVSQKVKNWLFLQTQKTPKHQEQIYTTTIDAATEGALK